MRLAPALLLLACSSRSAPNAEPAGSSPPPPRDAAVAIADVGGKMSLQIERRLPDPAWETAADIALGPLRAWAESDPALVRLVIQPLRAPDGSTVEHLLAYEAFTAQGPTVKSRVLVANGALVEKGDATTAAQFLRERGFPRRRLDAGLLCEVLAIHGVVGAGWVSSPAQLGWSVLETSHTTGTHKPVQLAYDDSGATLTLVRSAPGFDPKVGRLVDRLVIRFDMAAKLTITSAREQVDGSWKPIPPAP